MPIIILILAAVLALNSCSAPVAQTGPEDETTDVIPEDSLAGEAEDEPDDETDDTADTSPAEPMDEVEEIFQKIFLEECESSYTLVHNLFIDPSAYGIDLGKTEVSLGSFLPDEQDDEEIAAVQGYIDQLRTMDLDEKETQIVDMLEWQTGLVSRLNDEAFTYLGSLWTVTDGIQKTLFQYFSFYQIYTEEEIPYLIRLLEDIDRYIQEARVYTAYQAENGLLRFDEEAVMEYIDEVLGMEADDPVSSSLVEQIGQLGLDSDTEEEWTEAVEQAVRDHFYPGYETMKEILEEFREENQPLTGLANLPGGTEYYEILLDYYTGSTTSASEMDTRIQEIYDSGLGKMQNSILSDSSTDYADGSEPSGYDDPDTIIDDMQKKYTEKFPAVSDLSIVVEPMSDLEAADTSVLAYMMTTPVDYHGSYRVYYNPNTSEMDTVKFFETVAHESIPGHVYQMVWHHDTALYPVCYLLENFALQEGWANYAAAQALEWSDLTESEAQTYLLNERLSNMLILQIDMAINYYGESFSSVSSKYGLSQEGYNQICESPGLFFAYYYGQLVLEEFAEDAQDSMGSSFDWVAFNEMILDCGNINFDLMAASVDEFIGR